MKQFTLLTLLLLLLMAIAKADPIIITVSKVTVNGTSTSINGQVQVVNNLAIKTMPSGMDDPYYPNGKSLLWANQVLSFTNTTNWNIGTTISFCIGSSCANNINLSGVITNSPIGAYWSTPFADRQVTTTDGKVINLSFVHNPPGGEGRTQFSTTDILVNITRHSASEVPEPTTLLLLGTGLAFASRRLRKK